MSAALLLIDLQEDYLAARDLTPPRGETVAAAARLLARCRAVAMPIFHVWTTVRRARDERMPHWRRSGRWQCVEGTPGHAPPLLLLPLEGEEVVHKTHFSAFSADDLVARLRARGVDELWLAGVHLHACVRATALDAYRHGFTVAVAADAVASDQPLHGDETRRYLTARCARFVDGDVLTAEPRPAARATAASVLPVAALGGDRRQATDGAASVPHVAPATRAPLWRAPIADASVVDDAVASAAAAQRHWRTTTLALRLDLAERVARAVAAARESLARQMSAEVGKPLVDARSEVDFAVALVRAAARRAASVLDAAPAAPTRGGTERRRPLGTVALITPWNVPLAIPLGKIVPALLYGNSVVWKPAPAGTGIALEVMRLLAANDCADAVALVSGDHSTAERLLQHPLVDAASLTGSSAVGTCAQAICAARRIPLQAELGGNNGAIVWSDCDLDDAAAKLAAGAFGSAGQRCTANRRMIVDERCVDAFVERLVAATGALPWGDPLDAATRVGPLVSDAACARVSRVVARAHQAGAEVVTAAEHARRERALAEEGAYVPPRVVRCDDPDAEIAQHETFGPVAVVQAARGFREALDRLNGVPQGLVAALFSDDEERRATFLDAAHAGILKLGASTAGVGPEAPFVGWKASGIGPAEHGSGDPEFYTRAQAVYAEHPGDARG